MKVAIIGAGPAGLACAIELERHGITPDVFEQRHRPGEMFDHCAAVLEIFTRPQDPLKQLGDGFGISLRPIGPIKRITMKSPRKKATVRGKLGYFFMRGHDPASAESQLYGMLKSGIIANTRADYTDLSGRYDYVVVANGSYDITRTEGVYTALFRTKLVGATVVGDNFNTDELKMWIDTRYSKTAYAYMCPIERKRAFLGLVVPESTVEGAREHWKLFWELERHPFSQVNEILFEHNAGFVYPHQVGNLLFAGIAGGFQDPFLGFGLLSAVKSGTLAGRSIATGKQYDDLIVQLKEDMQNSITMRELMDNAENEDFDRLMRVLGTPGIKQFIYNTSIDFVRIGSAAVGNIINIMNKLKN